MANTPDAFEQLLEFKWRDVSFPATTFEVSLRHDVAIHKPPDVDGANVEPTGRDALVFRASIPFLNGTVPGKNESWGDIGPVTLYPTIYRDFLRAFADRTKGNLQHPELGIIECQPLELHSVWVAEKRGGAVVDVSWMETEDFSTDTLSIFAGESPVTTAERGAMDLDASLGPASDIFPQLEAFEPSFADTMRGITAFSDQISLLSKRAAGKIDSVAYQVNRLSDSIDAAKTSMLWPVRQNVERLKSSLPDLKKALGVKDKTLVFYVVPKDSTIAGIAVDTGAKLSDLITLNRDLVKSASVKSGTIVRYYK